LTTSLPLMIHGLSLSAAEVGDVTVGNFDQDFRQGYSKSQHSHSEYWLDDKSFVGIRTTNPGRAVGLTEASHLSEPVFSPCLLAPRICPHGNRALMLG
jgi:hypothetical protein